MTRNIDQYDVNALSRILAKIFIRGDTGCWEWQGSRHKQGYGTVQYRDRVRKVHRVTYELLVGPIPDGTVIDHFGCDNPPCCAPHHLRPVTQRENVLRGQGLASGNAAKTFCQAGHEFTPENTDVRPNGKRRCRSCHRIAARNAYAEKKMQAAGQRRSES